MNTARGTITAKAVRKEEKKERKAKEKDKEKTRNQLQIPVSKATAERVENGDTRRVSVGKDVQAVEEVPSSSAGSVAPSAATTPALRRQQH